MTQKFLPFLFSLTLSVSAMGQGSATTDESNYLVFHSGDGGTACNFIASVAATNVRDTREIPPGMGAGEYHYLLPTVTDPTGVTANAISSSQINVSFIPNGNNDNVVLVYNETGIFTAPSGPPPGSGPFAGGTFLYNGTFSPYNHTGLNPATKYYYKAFSYDGADYSPGVTVHETTPCGIFIAPFSESFATTSIPSCWTISGPQPWLFTTSWPSYGAAGVADHTPGGGGSFAGVDGSGSTGLTGITLLSPLINTSSLTAPAVKFYLFNNNIISPLPADGQQLTVDVWDGAAWNLALFTWAFDQNAAGWQEKTISLGSLTITGPVRLRFVVAKGTGSPLYDDLIIDDVSIFDATTPSLVVNPSSLEFGYKGFPGSSASQTYTLSGAYLTAGPIVVNAPAGFEVSLDGSTWSTSVNVNYTPPTLASATIYARFTPAASNTVYSDNITNTGGGAPTQNVAVTGTSLITYCPSSASSILDEEIYGVTVNGATNLSNCTTVASGPGSILNRYSNFYPLGSLTTLQVGQTIAFTVLEDECDSIPYYPNGCAMWIDWNQDADFLDAGERVYSESVTTNSPRTITGNFTVPAGATLGTTGLRVTVAEGYYGTTLTPCLAYSYGETEDYLVTISPFISPVIYAAPASLTFGTIASGTTSTEHTYSLSAYNLTPPSGNITITPPADFAVSLTTGGPYSSTPITVEYTGGGLSDTTVFAVFQPTSPSTVYSGDIANDGGGAPAANVAVSGNSTCGIVALPFSESFPTSALPYCWTEQFAGTIITSHWSMSNSANAGGATYEAMANWEPIQGAVITDQDRLITPPLNTAGVTALLVNFRQMLDDYNAAVNDVWIKVQSSADRIHWTDEWTYAGGLGNSIPAENKTLIITNNLGIKTYIAWTLCGNTYDINNWYVDNVSVIAQPAVELAFTRFYQASGSLAPTFGGSNYPASSNSHNANLILPEQPEGSSGHASNVNNTVLLNNQAPVGGPKYPSNPVGIEALLTNNGYSASTYSIAWEVDGVPQTPYSGPSVGANGGTHLASLTYTPVARGTFITSGTVVAAGDPMPTNNDNSFRMRVYPDVFTRTVYDNGTDTVDNYLGWNSTNIPMKAGVRYTAASDTKLAGVDYIYRTEAIASGTFLVQVRAAGTSTTVPGAVLYTQVYNAAAYFPGAGDYITFPFGDDAPTIAAGSDYWITIKAPEGILFPGGTHASGFTTGHSFFEGNADTTVWNALIIDLDEYAWIMRAIGVAPPPTKTLNVKVYLEGLYNTGTGSMNEAQGSSGAQWGAGIADKLTIELHNTTAPYGVTNTYSDILLNTDGTLSIGTIPVALTGSYYIVVKNRNHLETWSAAPVSFTGTGPIAYDFSTAASQAYGNNLKPMGTIWAIWAGDVTREGIIDGSDMAAVDNASSSVLFGYNVEDVNGDSLVDGSDMAIIDNNSTAIITVRKPE